MSTDLRVPALADKPDPAPLGVFGVPRIGWYACRGRDCRGHFIRRKLAEKELAGICKANEGLIERWMAALRMIGESLL